MTDHHSTDDLPTPKRLGLLAQFAGPDELIHAAEKVTDAGYRKVEAYTPFAVIGIDDALKAKGTILPWIVFCMGLTGCLIGITMQCYMNGTEGSWWLSGYEYLISAKPSFSIPAFVPVTFELTILLSAFGSFFGMLALNKLPKLFNPLLRSNRFADVTTDGFFLFVESTDGKYAEAETEAYLKSVGATAVEGIDEVVGGQSLPAGMQLIGASAATAALLVPLYLWMTSSTTTTLPRISLFKDMEHTAKFQAQQPSKLFADGRSMRPPVEGTVARGSRREDLRLYEGVEPEPAVARTRRSDLRFAGFSGGRAPARLAADGDQAQADSGAPTPGGDGMMPAGIEERNWTTEFPPSLKLDAAMMERGQQRFNIHCAACHGLTGAGDGLVTGRALALQQGTWLQPTSLHAEAVTTQPVGRIFNTISNGIRKMPGYREHITPEDRWAIVLYLKALQRSQNATAEDLPAEKLRELSNLK